jgi:hypothetical protein
VLGTIHRLLRNDLSSRRRDSPRNRVATQIFEPSTNCHTSARGLVRNEDGAGFQPTFQHNNSAPPCCGLQCRAQSLSILHQPAAGPPTFTTRSLDQDLQPDNHVFSYTPNVDVDFAPLYKILLARFSYLVYNNRRNKTVRMAFRMALYT